MTSHITGEELSANSQDKDKDIVLSVKGVSKKFCRSLKRSLFYGVQDIAGALSGMRGEKNELRHKEFWALNDVSFELRRGEALGLVGPNGSGKTTLMRIIAGLIKPDTGYVEVNGKVAPLIALGAGFNPILTGRENIYANMSILGLSRKEIDEKFDEVVEFAEIGEAIDAPVQSYSSGMAARLGFASAIHTKPDILLIDEVLAVGDAKFRAKCHRRLSELLKSGTAFMLVSHHAQTILNVCNCSVYLLRGKVITSGHTDSVVNKYEEDLFLSNSKHTTSSLTLPEKPVDQSSGLNIVSLFFRDKDGNKIDTLITGEPVFFCVECHVFREFSEIGLGFGIRKVAGDGNTVLMLSSFNDNQSFPVSCSNSKFELQVFFPHVGLIPSSYTMKVFVKDGAIAVLDSIDTFTFTVKGMKPISCSLFYQPRSWHCVLTQESDI